MRNFIPYALVLSSILVSCGHHVPEDFVASELSPNIYPEYIDITIPENIAPLNFKIQDDAQGYITHIYGKNSDGMVLKGQTIDIDADGWRSLLKDCASDTVFADVYVKSDDKWTKFKTIHYAVAEPIDPYVTYRLIEPSYVNFETMRIRQRCIEDFSEKDIFNNCTFASDDQGQCINCHNPHNYNRDNEWQMHVRLYNGGTIIAKGDNVKKVNLKVPQTISAGVYPAWHPTLPYIVYSNNNTMQIFHNYNKNKIEVQDGDSNLIIYDTEKGEIRNAASDITEWETFPAWSPDGRYLYYVSATVPDLPREEIDEWKREFYKDVKYNIYRREFDPKSLTFTDPDTVYMASDRGVSATLPRISPDGRYLLFTQAEYGTFHIWHHDADLYMIDLQEGTVEPLTEANSQDTESYHTWSSNGRWILFSSRRDDGSYTRLYISYFDKDGHASKPFLLPQKDPDSNIRLFKSYNVPEFMVRPVETDRNAIIEAIKNDAESATFAL